MPGKSPNRHPQGGPPGQNKGRRRKNSDGSDDGKEPINFEVYESAGNTYFSTREFRKAIDSYTKALDLRNGDVNCLISRSKCYLELGDLKKALNDGNAVLAEEKNHIKGLLQKAEVLYFMGDFETALVFYHRGNKLRPEIRSFKLGIQKAQEAINNSVGEDAGVELSSDGDLTFFYESQNQGKDEKQGKKKGGYSKPASRKDDRKEKNRPKSTHQDSKTVKQLLGELYADKEYLEGLLKDIDDSGAKTDTNIAIRDLSIEGLDYLNTRTEFWQQQKPMYSRKRDKQMRDGAASRAGTAGNKKNRTKWVVQKLEEIDKDQTDGKHEKSLKQAKKVLKDVEKWGDDELHNRPEVVANLHSCIGNSYLEMGEYEQALKHHNKDLEIANQKDLNDAKSRALDNLGRVHARMGRFDKAIKVWEDKLPLAKSALEKTWLYHEIGRCYLERNENLKAKDNGEKSLEAANEAEDDVWQLNASVLIAQSQVKLKDYQAAVDSFEKALDMAKLQNDKLAENAIKKALDDVNHRIIKSMKDSDDKDDTSSHGSRKGSPKGSPRGSRKGSPKGSPRGSRKGSPKGSPKHSPKHSPRGNKKGHDSPRGKGKGRDDSPGGSPKGSPKGSPRGSPRGAAKGHNKDDDNDKKDEIKYKITVVTGDKAFAGTDSDVFLNVYGSDGETGKKELRTEKDDFEQGKTNNFELNLLDIGKLDKINISHDGSNPGAGWYLDKIVIEIPSKNQEFTFIADRWLDSDEGDGKIELDIDPEDSGAKK